MIGVGIIFTALSVSTLATQPLITAELEKREAWLGDTVDMQVRVHFDDNWSFELTNLGDALGEATVISQDWKDAFEDADTQLNVLQLDVELAWYSLGEHVLPPIEVRGTSVDGQTKTLKTPELTINVTKMLDESDQSLAPPKGQVELPLPRLWPWVVGAVVLVALVGISIYWYLRSRKGDKARPMVAALAPYEEAISRLRDLTMSSLLKEGKFKQFYVEVNTVVRHYYARLFAIPAEEMTTYEIDHWIRERHDQGFTRINRQFHELCDMVKYARYEPAESEHNAVVNWAHEIVETLNPRDEGEGVDHVASG